VCPFPSCDGGKPRVTATRQAMRRHLVLHHDADLLVSHVDGVTRDTVVHLEGPELDRKRAVYKRGQRHQRKPYASPEPVSGVVGSVRVNRVAVTQPVAETPGLSSHDCATRNDFDFSFGQDFSFSLSEYDEGMNWGFVDLTDPFAGPGASTPSGGDVGGAVAATEIDSALAAVDDSGAAASPDVAVVVPSEGACCTDLVLAESAAAIIATSKSSVGVSEIVRQMTSNLKLNAVDQRRAVLAALSASMAEKLLAERILQLSLSGLVTDSSGSGPLGAIIVEVAGRRGRCLDTETESAAPKLSNVLSDEE
jgi:hypothetical protein